MQLLEELSEVALRRTGVHIGAPHCNVTMQQFIEKQERGYNIFNITKYLMRLNGVVHLLDKYEPETVVFISDNNALERILNTIQLYLNYSIYNKHFVPGSFSNPSLPSFIDANIVFLSSPGILRVVKYNNHVFNRTKGDWRARNEASLMNIPVVSLCNANDDVSMVDYIIPCNNIGTTQLITSYFIFLKLAMLARGEEDKIKHLTLNSFILPPVTLP